MSYTQDFKQKVLEIKKRDKLSVRKAAAFFELSTNTIRLWMKPPEQKISKARQMKVTDEQHLNDVAEFPDAFQYERAERLNCSQGTIQYRLRRLKITRKKRL